MTQNNSGSFNNPSHIDPPTLEWIKRSDETLIPKRSDFLGDPEGFRLAELRFHQARQAVYEDYNDGKFDLFF